MSAKQRELERMTKEVSDLIAAHVPGVGFAVLLFTFGPGFTAYASNANRQDMIRELRDLVNRLERESHGT